MAAVADEASLFVLPGNAAADSGQLPDNKRERGLGRGRQLQPLSPPRRRGMRSAALMLVRLQRAAAKKCIFSFARPPPVWAKVDYLCT